MKRVVTPEECEITSLKALWTYIKANEPETSILWLWFWHRLAQINMRKLNAQLKEMEEQNGRTIER